eukprot:3341508-Amphidinium_carterae.1
MAGASVRVFRSNRHKLGVVVGNDEKLEELAIKVAELTSTVHVTAVRPNEGDMVSSLSAKVEELARAIAKRERVGASSRWLAVGESLDAPHSTEGNDDSDTSHAPVGEDID